MYTRTMHFLSFFLIGILSVIPRVAVSEICPTVSFFGDTARNISHSVDLKKHYISLLEKSNTIWVDEHRIKEKLAVLKSMRMAGLNFNVVLNPYWTLFDSGVNLHVDYVDRWSVLSQQVKSSGLAIDAFYPIDEPFARGNTSQVRISETKIIIKKVIDLISSDFSNSEFWVIGSHLYLDSVAFLKSLYDVVGANCYGDFLNCGRSDKKVSVRDIYIELDDLPGLGSLMVVPGVFKSKSFNVESVTQIKKIHSNYIELMSEISSIEYITYFGFNSYIRKSGEKIIGISDMPEMDTELKKVYESYNCVSGN